MKKLLVYLEEDTHEDLKILALNKKTTMAALVRYALDATFEDELDAIAGQRALEEHLKNPDSSITLDDYLKERGIELPSHPVQQGKARPKKVASG